MDGSIGSVAERPAQRAELLAAVREAATSIIATAAERDEAARFPRAEMELLRRCGALSAPLPPTFGGLGMGTTAAATVDTIELLRLVGAASLPLGRLFEGHVNALRLICRLGSPDQARRAATDAFAGHLFGVWNTDPANAPLELASTCLLGAKILASGAGNVTRALVTAGEPRALLLVALEPGTRADLSAWTAQGMRASATGKLDFNGAPLTDVQVIGAPGAYLAQPDFSGGAWRVLAVQLGGLDALVGEVRAMLLERARADNPHQLARVGAMLIAAETAHLFVRRAAELAEANERDAEQVVAYVGLARLAVETACLDAMRLAQRSVGLAAFMRPAPIERICRDLATYLRQPAPDETLCEAAAYFIRHDLPR